MESDIFELCCIHDNWTYMKIAPSVLAADVKNLQSEIEKVYNADYIHLDIMDGHFVPNISFGSFIVKGLRPCAKIPFDVHLMLSYPLEYIEAFADAGADIISFHIECLNNPREVIEKIKSFGVKPAIAIKPNTPIEEVFPYCDDLFMVLIMTVEPGFGGQSFMAEPLKKARILKDKFPSLLIETDGGIGRGNVELCKNSGIDICVCGTSVFSAQNPSEEIEFLKKV